MVYRPSNRIAAIGGGWLMVAAGVIVAVVSMSDVHPFTGRFWSLIGGMFLVVLGIAETLYCEEERRYLVRLSWYFGGVLLITIGMGAFFFTRYSPYDEGLAVLGATLIIAGFGVAAYSGSFRQWRRRLWLTGLGLFVFAAGALVAGSIVAIVAVGVAQNPTPLSTGGGHRSESLAFYGVVVVGSASVSLIGAAIAFVKAWRTPQQPLRQPRWHQVGR